ncbi:hypothetical protein G647_04580 [Cladophialophora carrionii CBS 160.54]|uniref:Transcription factor domain-containing protein n=1 Tax=Cladophialophora carrionii CBS 160.54 TaxID=1279043 RepID=V9DGW5_9EURO|nr:uncharacterized protein G647_04580 [Cladophialophora carrionii CBS 160.54]ETI25207.1 hypothetical protein G647_04580 [Cladophialophora carrionii CBS 160.54]
MAFMREQGEPRLRLDVAVQYYQKALNAFSALLTKPDSAHSDEILASSIMLSSYEMFDVVGQNFGSHLRGVASLLQLWQITGESTGIKGVVYWTWYRSDTWAALHAGRRMFLDERYWEPRAVESLDQLSPEEIANRAVFLLGQCISFCNDDVGPETPETVGGLAATRQRTSTKLWDALEQWKRMLPPSMTHHVVAQVIRDDQDEEEQADQCLRAVSSMLFLSPHCGKSTPTFNKGP